MHTRPLLGNGSADASIARQWLSSRCMIAAIVQGQLGMVFSVRYVLYN
jgi:hypothetical protein